MTGRRYEISRSRTFNVPRIRLFKAWADDAQRILWLPEHPVKIRKAQPNSSMRITWSDESTSLNVYFFDQGLGRSSISVKHVKLAGQDAVRAMRSYWSAALGRLKDFVEQAETHRL
jgi:uncharacterized protein YndB with AHSA1/START domain